MPPQLPVTIAHCDESILICDKPAGLLAVPGRGEEKQDCLWTRVQSAYPEARVVHRLDMATSGLLLMARSAAIQSRLSGMFARRLVEKRYEAIVQGCIESDCGEIDLPLAADWPNRPRQCVDPDNGRQSLTRYRVLARDPAAGITRVELAPVTGRSHQLRVHLLAIGHPIVGDALYGKEGARLMLHATRLSFEHPASGQPFRCDSPAPF